MVASARLLPSEWARPVVEAVTLPAHAQTTGEVVQLCNAEPFIADTAPLPERPDSLLASGVETVNEALRRMITVAQAGDDPEDTLGCEPTGCARIRFVFGQNAGTLYMGVFDPNADGLSPIEVSVPFVDGVNGSFASTCLFPIFDGYRVELINEFAALLTLIVDGGNATFPVNLGRECNCTPLLSDDF